MPAQPALFGKLPSHGDFVSRNLTPATSALWDTWASGYVRALAESGSSAQDGLTLHFLSGPGPLGPSWRAGSLAPTRDRAGRDFVAVLMMDGMDSEEAGSLAPLVCRDSAEIIQHAVAETLSADETRDLMDEVWQGYDRALVPVMASFLTMPRDRFSAWWSPGGLVSYSDAPPPPTAVAVSF